MKTFLDFLNESSTSKGNYVSISASLDKIDVDLLGGKFTKEPHVTLMYSDKTNIDNKLIEDALAAIKTPIVAKYAAIDIFGEDDNKAVVIKLESKELHDIHQKLKTLGLKHTYDFQPHLTLVYKLSHDNALKLKDELNDMFTGAEFTLDTFTVEAIDKNWVDSDD